MDARLLSENDLRLIAHVWDGRGTGADVRRLLAHAAAQEETIRRLRDALKPFAEVGDVITHADEKCVLEVDNHAKVVFVYGGDFRNAKRVYEETQG